MAFIFLKTTWDITQVGTSHARTETHKISVLATQRLIK